uniref:Uncharacterized protein n=1 Tax=Cacopsylla melanoneura TaxID=428564 RepID=A0A8D8X2T1_9HEMI
MRIRQSNGESIITIGNIDQSSSQTFKATSAEARVVGVEVTIVQGSFLEVIFVDREMRHFVQFTNPFHRNSSTQRLSEEQKFIVWLDLGGELCSIRSSINISTRQIPLW